MLLDSLPNVRILHITINRIIFSFQALDRPPIVAKIDRISVYQRVLDTITYSIIITSMSARELG
jgi:hypothetical protein